MKFDMDCILSTLENNAHRIRSKAKCTTSETNPENSIRIGLELAKAGNFSEAINHIERLKGNWEEIGTELREELAQTWALALYATGRGEDLREFTANMIRSLSSETQALILIKLAWAELMAGEEGQSQAAADRAKRAAGEPSPDIVLAELMYLEGYWSLAHSGSLKIARRKIELACELFRLHGNKLLLARALQAQAEVHRGMGHVCYARSLVFESLGIAATLGNLRTASTALRQLAIFDYQQAAFDNARSHLANATRLAEKHDPDRGSNSLRIELCSVRLELLAENTRTAAESLARLKACMPMMDATSVAMWHEYRAIAFAQQLDYMAALRSFGKAKRSLAQSGTKTYEAAEVSWQEAQVHLAMQNPRIALDLANEALDIIVACGNYREYGQILRVKATALAQLARPQDAILLFREAIDELRHHNNPLELGRTLMSFSELTELDALPATDSATEALAIFTRLQLSALANEARQARDLARLRFQASRSTEGMEHTVSKEGQLVAVSPRMKVLLADCDLIARSTSPAVIMGATGVGKEVVARYIHERSGYSEGPFVAVNCAAFPESLFERELFGHKKGAFTGADRDTAGVVAAASGGTLFLDEIGELPMTMQAKLLRLLQENTYRRVGDVTEYHADIRVLAATNCDLRKHVTDKTFREDLWYRINAFEVRIPPLRERSEDIAPLTDRFLEEQSREYGIEFWMDQQVRRLFERYSWPGNVRELQSAVRAGAARAQDDGRVRVRHLPHALRESKTKKPPPILSLQQHLEVEERRIILHALRKCKNSRSQAARYLGIGRNTLYEKMQRLGIALDKEAKS